MKVYCFLILLKKSKKLKIQLDNKVNTNYTTPESPKYVKKQCFAAFVLIQKNATCGESTTYPIIIY
jgi:hypothetical protein